ncbi:MAG: GNAT family N-acetyltransferase, partial [Candidatus Hodarchaeota archaeon]
MIITNINLPASQNPKEKVYQKQLGDLCSCAEALRLTNSSDVEIRRLENADEAETCARMMAGSEPWITLGRDYEASLEIVSDPSMEVYLALRDDEIVGFVVISLTGAFIGYVKSIYTAPGWRNKGIGSKLMSFVEDRIFREAPNVFICVSDFNEDAQRLYRRLGYEVVGELKDYLVSGKSEILMRKTIAPLAEFKM